jgi:hypothetical protein
MSKQQQINKLIQAYKEIEQGKNVCIKLLNLYYKPGKKEDPLFLYLFNFYFKLHEESIKLMKQIEQFSYSLSEKHE